MSVREFPAGSSNPHESMIFSGIRVDQEGDWYYEGDKIVREDILDMFFTHLGMAAEGVFFVEWRGQRCAIEVVDTPFVVTRIDRVPSKGGDGEEILIRLKHVHTPEILDPTTLRIGLNNIPYCCIRNRRYRARFSRPAYYQLAAWIDFDTDSQIYFLELNERRFAIDTSATSASQASSAP